MKRAFYRQRSFPAQNGIKWQTVDEETFQAFFSSCKRKDSRFHLIDFGIIMQPLMGEFFQLPLSVVLNSVIFAIAENISESIKWDIQQHRFLGHLCGGDNSRENNFFPSIHFWHGNWVLLIFTSVESSIKIHIDCIFLSDQNNWQIGWENLFQCAWRHKRLRLLNSCLNSYNDWLAY